MPTIDTKPRLIDGSWVRFDQYETGRRQIFVTGSKDRSPVQVGEYNQNCSCCWLGYPHSQNYHRESLSRPPG
jgi:hypothetical protein